jgi:predicted HTH transcriptional regulator
MKFSSKRFSEEEIQIYRLIKQGEHQQLDFKHEIDDARKIARAMAAFANSSGGTLLIGVKDNGSIVGIKTDEELYMLQAAAEYYSKPKISYKVEVIEIENKTILKVSIPASKTLPHFVKNESGKWQAYYRVDDKNILLNHLAIQILKNTHKQQRKRHVLSKNELKIIATFKENNIQNIKNIEEKSLLPYSIIQNTLIKLVQLNILTYKITISGISFELNKNSFSDNYSLEDK